MKVVLPLLAALLGVLAVACVAGTATRGRAQHPVYSVADIQIRLAEAPHAWVGRIVWVRGAAVACAVHLDSGHFHCTPGLPRFLDTDARSETTPLLLAWRSPDPLWAAVRRAPLLGSLLSAPRTVQWGVPATYRVRLRTLAGGLPGDTVYHEALLLDVVARA